MLDKTYPVASIVDGFADQAEKEGARSTAFGPRSGRDQVR